MKKVISPLLLTLTFLTVPSLAIASSCEEDEVLVCYEDENGDYICKCKTVTTA